MRYRPPDFPATDLRETLDASPAPRNLTGRYAQSIIVQVGHTVYAHAGLNLEARLARWIPMAHDRLDEDELPLTHAFMAMRPAVRRPGVMTATHITEGAGTMIRPSAAKVFGQLVQREGADGNLGQDGQKPCARPWLEHPVGRGDRCGGQRDIIAGS